MAPDQSFSNLHNSVLSSLCPHNKDSIFSENKHSLYYTLRVWHLQITSFFRLALMPASEEAERKPEPMTLGTAQAMQQTPIPSKAFYSLKNGMKTGKIRAF